jgi:hypothetical protein
MENQSPNFGAGQRLHIVHETASCVRDSHPMKVSQAFILSRVGASGTEMHQWFRETKGVVTILNKLLISFSRLESVSPWRRCRSTAGRLSRVKTLLCFVVHLLIFRLNQDSVLNA